MFEEGDRPSRRAALALLAAAGSLGALPLAGCAAESQALQAVAGPRRMDPHPVPPASDGISFSILPFLGTPTNTSDAVYRKIRELAGRENLKLVLRLDLPVTYRVRGYMSAVAAGTATTVVFDVEVFDGTGRRVHRFSGQEIGGAAVGDPWSGVSSSTTDQLAARIVEALKAWVTRAA